jgi:hypothetical protein
LESTRKLAEQIRFRAEMAEGKISGSLAALHFLAHFQSVESMHRIPFQNLRAYTFTPKDMLKAVHDGRRAGAR